jgi:hypothetical protein
MAISGRGPPYKPGLSIRGRVLFDTVRGSPRARPWPPSRPTKDGSARQRTARAFAAANRACKVTEASWYGEHWQATRGTPLLPRDLMIAFMYGRAITLIDQNGKTIYSMAARADVSKSLDVLGNTPGDFLVRGPKFWEVMKAPPINPGVFLRQEAAAQTINFFTRQDATWDTTVYDAGNWQSDPSNPQVLIVPDDVHFAQATLNVGLDSYTGQWCVVRLLLDEGSGFDPVANFMVGQFASIIRVNCITPILPVVPGNRFKADILYNSNQNSQYVTQSNWIQVRAI